MSHIARELKMLFYLNSHRNRYVKIDELSDLLEVTPRQVRRYRDDLDQNGYSVEQLTGPTGGYRLIDSLDKSLMIPDNIMLALTLSSKNNESLLKTLHDLPVVPNIKKNLDGDNYISDHDIEVLSIISTAIKENKRIRFDYDIYDGRTIDVEPYKIYYTHHTYYLRGYSLFKQALRKYDIDKISNIKLTDSFVPNESLTKQTDEELSIYGIFDETEETIELKLKYFNDRDASMIDRYFEFKGSLDKENRIYTVKTKNNAEPFYIIFALHHKVEIINEDVRRHYINYLKNYVNKLEG